MILKRVGRTFTATSDNGAWLRIGKVRQQANGDYRAEVRLFEGDVPIYASMLNLSVGSSREKAVKALATKNGKIPWQGMLNDACLQVLDMLSTGDALEVIDTAEPVPQSRYLLDPILPANQPTIIFARGGRGKSYLTLFLALLLQIPVRDNAFGWVVTDRAPALYLDWEADRGTIHARAQRLLRGLSAPHQKIAYRHCDRPLADDLDAIEGLLMDTGAKLLVVDSIGVALGADPSDPGKAVPFFGLLRELNVTSLLVHHEAKGDMTGKSRTPYGSVYFENLARSVWHVDKVQEVGGNELLLALEHTKANDSTLHPPIGLRMEFDNMAGTTTVTPADLAEVPELSGHLPLTLRIPGLLSGGARSIEELAQDTDSKEDTVSRTLRRMRDKGQVVKLGDGTWGLSI